MAAQNAEAPPADPPVAVANQQVIVTQRDPYQLVTNSFKVFCKEQQLKDGEVLDWLEVLVWGCSTTFVGVSNRMVWEVMARSRWTPSSLARSWAGIQAGGVQGNDNFAANDFESVLPGNWYTGGFLGFTADSLSDRHFANVEKLLRMAQFAESVLLQWQVNDLAIMCRRASKLGAEVKRGFVVVQQTSIS